jgi:hypothetical protein
VLKGADLKRKRVRALHQSIAAKCFQIRADVAQGELFRDLERVTQKNQGECHQAFLRPLRMAFAVRTLRLGVMSDVAEISTLKAIEET